METVTKRSIAAWVLGLLAVVPATWVPTQALAGAADRESYYYHQKPWAPIELSGRITDVKQVPVHGLPSARQSVVVKITPDPSRRGRNYEYERIVDLGDRSRVGSISRGDHIMVWGNLRNVNETPVVFADSFQTDDGRTIDAARDPAFRKGYMWGRPLRDRDVYEFENIDIDDGDSWYFDSYEYVGYPYRELPPGASAPWARNERAFTQRRAERLREDQGYARAGAVKSDQQLKRDVESELTWSPFVDADKVQVTVRRGVVTLSGKVEDRDEIQSAIDNAYEAGAKDVISKLTTEE